MNVLPIVLAGRRVRLEPMQASHLGSLVAAGAHEALWQWTNTRADSAEGMTAYVNEALTAAAAGAALPLVTVDIASGETIGSTRFANIDHAALDQSQQQAKRPDGLQATIERHRMLSTQ